MITRRKNHNNKGKKSEKENLHKRKKWTRVDN